MASYCSHVHRNLEEQQQKPPTRSSKLSKQSISNSKIQRMVVDTSRIPIPTQRSASRDALNSSSSSRPTSAAGRRRGSLAISRASLLSAANQKLYNAQNYSIQSTQM